MALAIKTTDLTKQYKDLIAVNKLNLEIQEGELYSLLGVNGAGKTTTIKMLSTLALPTSGTAIVNSYDIVKDHNSIKNIIGVSPQETAVANNLTVLENLKFICGIYKFDKIRTAKKIEEITDALHLKDVLNKRPSKLSGGYQRRLSIALALITNPKILFLDEPTLGLDVLARNELWDFIRTLKSKITIILTTHYMEEAEALSDHIGIMKDGKLLISDTPDKIMEQTNTTRIEDAFISIVKEA